jgi:phosphate transport system substrate-binding protein
MRAFCAAIAVACLISWTAPSTAAGEVTLTSVDGDLSVTGILQSYDGELYRIETEYGPLTVDGLKVSCSGEACPDLAAIVPSLTISGSRTMGQILMPALVETFAARKGLSVERDLIDETHITYRLMQGSNGREAARFAFRITSTSEGFADLVAAEADLVLSTREVTAAEAQLGQEAGLGDLTVARRSRIVAIDGMVPVVSRANPLDGLTLEDLARIFAGEVTDWAELGGNEGPITLHIRDWQSGLTEEFQRRVLRPAGKILARRAVRHLDNESLAEAVAADPSALGIAAFSDRGRAKALDILGTCGQRSRATPLSLKAEDYPLTTPLFVYTDNGRPSPLEREFMAYVRSSTAQAVIARSGFVDLRVVPVPLDGQGLRLANAISAAGRDVGLSELKRLVAALRDTQRLTLSFRFEAGSARLDALSRSNVDALAALLEAGQFDEKELRIVGFTDGQGAPDANLRTARRQAETVRRAVLRAAPAADRERLNIVVDAFGEAMPMACEDSSWGRLANRRVEVWVK